MKHVILALAVWLLIAAPAWAGFAEAVAAYKRGDYATALREWRPLAEQGNASVQYNLGIMYAKGRGVAQDDSEAVRWFARAAEQGNTDAQYALGLMYGHGRGVPRDYVKAVRLWRPIADKGDDDAQYVMGLMYANGTGVPQDYLQAYKWYNLAASQGNRLALEARDALARGMTPADISRAQQLTREWWGAFQKRTGR